MTEENNNIINNTESKPRGRPRVPEELKKKYIPKPKKEKKVKPTKEPYEKLKAGRKTGIILKPERHREDGSYVTGPLDPEYYKNYYHQVINQPYTCPHCNMNLASRQKIKRHEATTYCTRSRLFKNIPDFETLFPMLEAFFPEVEFQKTDGPDED